MASSPGSAERRANLIREMSRQGNRSNSRASVGSSDAGSEHIVVKDWGQYTYHMLMCLCKLTAT